MDQFTPEEAAKVKGILAVLGDVTPEQIGAMFAVAKSAADAAQARIEVATLRAQQQEIEARIQAVQSAAVLPGM